MSRNRDRRYGANVHNTYHMRTLRERLEEARQTASAPVVTRVNPTTGWDRAVGTRLPVSVRVESLRNATIRIDNYVQQQLRAMWLDSLRSANSGAAQNEVGRAVGGVSRTGGSIEQYVHASACRSMQDLRDLHFGVLDELESRDFDASVTAASTRIQDIVVLGGGHVHTRKTVSNLVQSLYRRRYIMLSTRFLRASSAVPPIASPTMRTISMLELLGAPLCNRNDLPGGRVDPYTRVPSLSALDFLSLLSAYVPHGFPSELRRIAQQLPVYFSSMFLWNSLGNAIGRHEFKEILDAESAHPSSLHDRHSISLAQFRHELMEYCRRRDLAEISSFISLEPLSIRMQGAFPIPRRQLGLLAVVYPAAIMASLTDRTRVDGTPVHGLLLASLVAAISEVGVSLLWSGKGMPWLYERAEEFVRKAHRRTVSGYPVYELVGDKGSKSLQVKDSDAG